jgi:RNA polymerase sigma factor (sigma-70 family)
MTASELQPYLNEIGRHPILSQEAQLRHCRRIRAWYTFTPEGATDPDPKAAPAHIIRAGRRSMDTMVRTNLRLVVYVAKSYQKRGLDMLDLIQEGSLGLVRGLELFDPSRGYAFSTYAFWWIRQAITRAIYNQSRLIRLPVNTQDKLYRAQRFVTQYTNIHGQPPSFSEVAENQGLDLQYLLEILELNDITHCSSLDAIICDSENSILNNLRSHVTVSNSPEVALHADCVHTLVDDIVATLPAEQAYIVRQTELKGRTLKDVSTELGMTRQHTSHLRRLAHRSMRTTLVCNYDLTEAL